MFYTGVTRPANKILKVQKDNLLNKENVNNIHKLVNLTKELKKELHNGNIDSFGDILNQGWMYKKEMAKEISNSLIDDIYYKACNNGAIGGKLLGAGGGGFFLFYCKEENQNKLIYSLKEYRKLDFKFDQTGSIIVYGD